MPPIRAFEKHQLLAQERSKADKTLLRKLLSILKQLNDITDRTHVPISNYAIYKECGTHVDAKIGKDEMYRISFDNFNLYVSVTGQSPRICKLLLIKIGKWS
ncbi:hypothetical protein D1AOALGA4SA_933 [Olavius algarvensis Delta 1 endosymbiont]|nr:hypothetical protein D1AOALGA4SA_933 [Olavius algarvensis Delta 1 endosymbiont]